MPEVRLAGEDLHYWVHPTGEGTPPRLALLLVHGAGGNLMHWPHALRRAEPAGVAVYALDLPGHGKSGGRGRTELGAYAEVVREFGEALHLPPLVLGGHSMGGAIALEFALRYPERLAGLILVATGAQLWVAPEILDGISSDFAGTAELITRWGHGEDVAPVARQLYLRRLLELDPQVFHGDLLACQAFDRRADAARIALPTLILCGAADRMTPPEFSTYLHEQIAGSQLVVLPGAGHMVMLERPAVVVEEVVRFLAGLPR